MIPVPESCKIYTPPSLAEAIVRELGDIPSSRWLEPSAGGGVFLDAISRLGVRREQVTAVDISDESGPYDHLATTIRGQDFVSWSLSTQERFDRIVGNPPYVRICRLDKSLRDTALRVNEPDGTPMRLGANYWHVFVCACFSLLNRGGSLALVLPASWDYADYSAPLRDTLPKLFRSVVVHRSLRPLFSTVGEGSIVLIAKGYGEQPEHHARYVHADLSTLVEALCAGEQGVATITDSQIERASTENGLVPFGDIADVLIGAVTGDAKYFLVTEQQRLARNLPWNCCRPILTRAKHLRGGEVSLDDWRQLRDEEHRVWLFSPSADLLADGAVRAYLELPADKGGPDRQAYWLQKRDPWYQVELPPHPHGFMSGMRSTGPWICINRSPELTASNTLYVVRFRGDVSEDERYAWALAMLTSCAAVQLAKSCRLYPDGLMKFEPSDLKKLRLPRPAPSRNARLSYLNAVSHLLNGETPKAREIADKWFADQTNVIAADEVCAQRVAETSVGYHV